MYDRLIQKYSRKGVFKDVDSMPLGVDFRAYIAEVLRQCAVCLVVIGQHWLGERDGNSARRIDEPRDFVRIEIETALKLGVAVIPVFVNGASMPEERLLPETVVDLAYRNGQQVPRDPDFHQDVDRLILLRHK